MSAVTAQQAALRILLEDVEPLLQRTEAAAAQLRNAHEGLESDLARLSALVQRSAEAPAALLEAGARLDSAAARIEAASAPAPARRAGAPWRAPPPRWRSAAGAGLLCLVGVTGAAGGALAAMAMAREDATQARLGRALARGWPSLDPATRAKVEAALRP